MSESSARIDTLQQGDLIVDSIQNVEHIFGSGVDKDWIGHKRRNFPLMFLSLKPIQSPHDVVTSMEVLVAEGRFVSFIVNKTWHLDITRR